MSERATRRTCVRATDADPRELPDASPLLSREPGNDGGYWAFADRMQALLEPSWRERDGAYRPRSAEGETSYNANLLYTHAAAAHAGHRGPARQDARARQLVERLCASPPWRPDLRASASRCTDPPRELAADQTHAYGWGAALNHMGVQHVVIDTVVIRALAQAYAARAQLGLSDAAVALIRDRIGKASTSTFYTYPALRLNQINWPIEIYAHAHEVLGTRRLLRHDCRLQLARFADALTTPAPGMRTPNTGPGYRFHYLPQLRAAVATNLDSAEYATIVCGALLYYDEARSAGMAALDGGQIRRIRAWVARVLCGYWTHGGWLNWDTGLSFARWQQIKKPPLSQQSLLAIALSPRFQPTASYGRWARYLFDRGLAFFDRLAAEADGLPPPVLFGVTATRGAPGDPELAVARMQANAAQADVLGLSRVRAEQPPPLYAYDPDIGRLAVTTPTYNTAVITVGQDRLPYGGAELARLYDGDQRVAATIGGRGAAAFGVVVRDRRSGRVTTTQRPRSTPDLRHPPLRLVRAPRGAVAHPVAYPLLPYAGPFETLEAVATTRGPGLTIRTRHRFTRRYVETSWRVLPARRRDRHDVSIRFPTTGAGASVTAMLRNGHAVALTHAVRLRDVAWFHLAGAECGYVVVLRTAGLPGVARLRHVAPLDSAPRPGPSLALELVGNGTLRPLAATVRIAPARDLAAARRVAAALRSSP